jgi:hypothetical protein
MPGKAARNAVTKNLRPPCAHAALRQRPGYAALRQRPGYAALRQRRARKCGGIRLPTANGLPATGSYANRCCF